MVTKPPSLYATITKFLKLFNSLKNRYQNNSKSMRGSQFVFHYVYLLHYKCHKINLNCGGSYINSPDLIKTKTKKQQ